MATYQMPNQRIALKVQYLTSSCHTAAGAALHFFQVVEQGVRAGGKPQKRIVVLVDRPTFLAELDTAINRCVMVSKIEHMCLFEEDLRALTGPLTQYDVLLQMSSMLDFIRTIGCIFKPNDPMNPSTMYELEENQPIAARVNCRLSRVAVDDAFSKRQSEEVIKRIKEANAREVAALREAMQKQKEEQLHELVDLHTQNEQLKHTLAQTENLLMEARRLGKDERIALMGQNQALQVELRERDSRLAVGPELDPVPRHEPPVTGYAGSQRLSGSPRPPSPRPHGGVINIYTGAGPPHVITDDGDGDPHGSFSPPGTGHWDPRYGARYSRSPGAVRPQPLPGDIQPRYPSPSRRQAQSPKPGWRY
eukprot:TRINITY_DN18694_c0_g1_i1.p1 TRINITY_DN18694_c0_g1~~TRINITY_DN18694_c0_g1_i1.p1  ORF type:complete len:363 (+),score=93.57 TRINITY_DN18694_c0_g1_i1:107-1195(+)